MEKIKLNDRTFKVMIPAEQIDVAVSKVAERLNADYADTKQPPIFVGVLCGAFVFLADVMRKVNFTNEVTFIQVSSYQGTQSTGNVQQKLGIDFDIAGRDIIIV